MFTELVKVDESFLLWKFQIVSNFLSGLWYFSSKVANKVAAWNTIRDIMTETVYVHKYSKIFDMDTRIRLWLRYE